MAAHASRLFFRRLRRRGRAGAALHIDLVAAFYRCLPELALGPLGSAEQRARLLERLGFSADRCRDFERDVVERGGDIRALGGDPAWAALAADWHVASWFSVPGCSKVARTWSGA